MEIFLSFASLAAQLSAHAAAVRPVDGARDNLAKFAALVMCALLDMLICLCAAMDARAAANVHPVVASSLGGDKAALVLTRARGQAFPGKRHAQRPSLAPEAHVGAAKQADDASLQTTPATPAGPWLAWSRDPGPRRTAPASPVAEKRVFRSAPTHALIVIISEQLECKGYDPHGRRNGGRRPLRVASLSWTDSRSQNQSFRWPRRSLTFVAMQVHGSCATRDGVGVLLVGPSGSGKSDLLLRLLDRGYVLVADDRVEIVDGIASPPPALAGLLEVRGLGIFRLPHVASVRIALAVALGGGYDRLPMPGRYPGLDVPLVALDATAASAPERVTLALDCALGRTRQVVGAFAT